MFEFDVVSENIPCLLSKTALKRAGAILYLHEDKINIFGKDITLDTTSSGHYAISLDNVEQQKNEAVSTGLEETVFLGVLDENEGKKEKQLVKSQTILPYITGDHEANVEGVRSSRQISTGYFRQNL